MKLGVVFPQLHIGADPVYVRDYAQTAEALGYDYMAIYDHVVGITADRPGGLSGPYDENSMFHEPFVLYGYFAAVTQRIELPTGIIILPQRQATLVAKQAAEVDVLSGGRLRLGVAVGYYPAEFEAMGANFHVRGRMMDEQLD